MSEHIAVWTTDANGLMTAPMIWVGTATTSGGTWSVDYSAAGFVETPFVTATAQLTASNVYDRAWASLSSAPTTTGCAGYGLRGANLLALGSTTRTVADGTTIHVIAVGETSLVT